MSDDRLERYRERRDLRRSPEPGARSRGKRGKARFVVQMHDASTLHFDFRLEVGGVLKSWAVPKGPSTDPRDKRLAMPTEDHPLDYADFEGVIPEGRYGAGAVVVWDRGTYESLREEDGEPMPLERSLEDGRAEVWLEGEKIRGGYALVRVSKAGEEERWLLIKMKDDGADARRKPTETERESVLSGRTIEDLYAEEEEGEG